MLMYSIDKCLILKYHRKSEILNKRALFLFMRMMKVGVFLHIVTGSLMFMNDRIFRQKEALNQLLTKKEGKGERVMITMNYTPHITYFASC